MRTPNDAIRQRADSRLGRSLIRENLFAQEPRLSEQ
jgi:hypothetical protein